MFHILVGRLSIPRPFLFLSGILKTFLLLESGWNYQYVFDSMSLEVLRNGQFR